MGWRQRAVLAADTSFFTVAPCPFPTGVLEGTGFCAETPSMCMEREAGPTRMRLFQLLPGVTSHVTTVSLLLPMGQLPGSFAYFINIF